MHRLRKHPKINLVAGRGEPSCHREIVLQQYIPRADEQQSRRQASKVAVEGGDVGNSPISDVPGVRLDEPLVGIQPATRRLPAQVVRAELQHGTDDRINETRSRSRSSVVAASVAPADASPIRIRSAPSVLRPSSTNHTAAVSQSSGAAGASPVRGPRPSSLTKGCRAPTYEHLANRGAQKLERARPLSRNHP